MKKVIWGIILFVILFISCGQMAKPDVMISPEGRLVVKDANGGVTVYTDSDSDGAYDITAVLEPAGVKTITLPSAGRIILQNIGVKVYVDTGHDGNYFLRNVLASSNVAEMKLTAQGRIILRDKAGRVIVYADTDGEGSYDSVQTLAVSGIKEIQLPSDQEILLRYTTGKLVMVRDKDQDSVYEIIDTLAVSGVDWLSLKNQQVFFRIKGVVTAVADLEADGIYERRFTFPLSNVSEVIFTADKRVLVKTSRGALVIFYDKQGNCNYDTWQVLLNSGLKSYSFPTKDKIILESTDGMVAIYWDKNQDGYYENFNLFAAPKSSK